MGLDISLGLWYNSSRKGKVYGLTKLKYFVRANFWSDTKNEVARITKVGGKVICCGWNTMGIGKTRGFRMTL